MDKLLIFVDANSDLAFADFASENIFLFLSQNSRVKITLNQVDFSRFNLTVILKENSNLDIFVHQDAQKSISHFDYYLLGENASVNHIQVGVQQKDENQQIFVNQHHEVPNCSSNIYIKKLLQDSAKSFYNGLISIDKNGFNSKANQQQKVLMFGDQTQNIAMPSLMVENNQVSCKHGAAVGKIDEEVLWYMSSRGLSRELARKLIIDGFFSDSKFLPFLDKNNSLILQSLREKIYFE